MPWKMQSRWLSQNKDRLLQFAAGRQLLFLPYQKQRWWGQTQWRARPRPGFPSCRQPWERCGGWRSAHSQRSWRQRSCRVSGRQLEPWWGRWGWRWCLVCGGDEAEGEEDGRGGCCEVLWLASGCGEEPSALPGMGWMAIEQSVSLSSCHYKNIAILNYDIWQ